ncbi:hypothetical protein Cj8486_0413 [Campylobacter jejuni subsp. jejuni CG8486]|nr:hypothetical protein Cj8486_0413 [Campylobacter jejuni subsp. jejuni CG8486]
MLFSKSSSNLKPSITIRYKLGLYFLQLYKVLTSMSSSYAISRLLFFVIFYLKNLAFRKFYIKISLLKTLEIFNLLYKIYLIFQY